ncbi:Ribonuclease H-like superfamily [Sesbania bispinosa]|nr:Ribonuclease H-like superfamily [Sesbania bispinosa]
MGKLGYTRRFMPALNELVGLMGELLKENNKYTWEKIHQEAFEKIKKAVASAPIMSPPVKGTPLRLYLAVSQRMINGLIAQEVEGTEHPVSYLSKMMKDVEASKSEGIKLMLSNSSITGRLSKWVLLLSKYNIQLVQPHKLGCQAITDMITLCSNQCEEDISKDIRGGVPELNFPCTKNEVEYEALILGLKMALEMKVECLNVQGDSNLVIKQLKGEYGIKETSLAMYRDEAWRLINFFKEQRSWRSSNDIVTFNKIAKPSLSIVPHEDESTDWRKPIMSQFKQKIFTKATRDYHELKGKLYRKSTDGLLMKCVTEMVGGKKLECLHQVVCGQEGPCLYRRMQRIGMYWPSMKAHCEEVQRACQSCREGRKPMEVNTVEDDWRKELKDFLSMGITPSSPREVEKLKRKAERYFMQEGELFKESFSRNILEEQEIVMGETHGGVCRRHQGGRSLWAEILKNRMAMGEEEERSEVAELVDGVRDKAEEEAMRHHRRLTLTYEKMVRPRMFREGELVLKATDAVMRKHHVTKWAPNLEGPYIVQDAQNNGYCTLIDPEDQRIIGPINFKYVSYSP